MTWVGPERGACMSVLVSWNLKEHAHRCVLCGEDTFQARGIYTHSGPLGNLGKAQALNLLLQFHSASQEGDRGHERDSLCS